MADPVQEVGGLPFHQVEHLRKEIAYRRDVFWRSLDRFGGLALAALVVPLTSSHLLRDLGWGTLIFPAIVFAVVGVGSLQISHNDTRLRVLSRVHLPTIDALQKAEAKAEDELGVGKRGVNPARLLSWSFSYGLSVLAAAEVLYIVLGLLCR